MSTEFSGADTSGDEAAKIEDMGTVSIVSGLLGMSEAELQRCLTSRNIGTRSIITCTLTPTQVCICVVVVVVVVLLLQVDVTQ